MRQFGLVEQAAHRPERATGHASWGSNDAAKMRVSVCMPGSTRRSGVSRYGPVLFAGLGGGGRLTNCLTTGRVPTDVGTHQGTGLCSIGLRRTCMNGLGMLDTEEVTGSNPVSPTIHGQPLTSGDAGRGLFSCQPMKANYDLFRAFE